MSIGDFADGWRTRAREHAARNAARAIEMRRIANELAQMLARDFGATRVVLFGSVARGDVGSRSDIDLLVHGIPAEHFITACAAADKLAASHVDLVPAENARREVLERATSEGVVLHG